jgi:hypothetical protein
MSLYCIDEIIFREIPESVWRFYVHISQLARGAGGGGREISLILYCLA